MKTALAFLLLTLGSGVIGLNSKNSNKAVLGVILLDLGWILLKG